MLPGIGVNQRAMAWSLSLSITKTLVATASCHIIIRVTTRDDIRKGPFFVNVECDVFIAVQ